MKQYCIDIIDLIEDKEFPARRNITDYIILLLQDLDVEKSLVYSIDKIFCDEYEKRGEMVGVSQSQIKYTINQALTEQKEKISKAWESLSHSERSFINPTSIIEPIIV